MKTSRIFVVTCHWIGEADFLIVCDSYRYVDWLLTVPLLLIELILVVGLPADRAASLSWELGFASAVMVCLGYPGGIQDGAG